METTQSIFSKASKISELVRYKECDREQIHLLGHIQPHGVLICIDESDLKILQVSENTAKFFGLSASSLINQPLTILFPQSQIEKLQSFLSQEDIEVFNPIKLTLQIRSKKHHCQGVIHRSEGLLILELEHLSKDVNSNLEFYYLSKIAAANIRRAKDFSEMANLLVQEIRKITQFDRVLIYKFDSDGNGVVIAENKAEHLEPLLGLHYPSSDIPEIPRTLYCKNWLRLIVDVNYQPVPIIPLHNPLTQRTLDLSYSNLRSVSQFHVKYLQKMGVAASFSISLVDSGKLWGLVVCHHYTSKYIDYENRKTCEFLGQIMSVEIVNKHEHQLKKAQEKIAMLQSRLKQNILGDRQSIYTFSQDPDSLLSLVNAQGAVICLGDNIYEIGICPPRDFIVGLTKWIETKSQDVFYTTCLSESYPEALQVKDQASGLLSISISLNYSSYHIIWFREEVIQTVNWAGDPSKLLDIDDDDEEPSPRRSFELWKETVKAKSLPWTVVETEAALELRGTLILAALEFSQQSLKLEAERAKVASQAKSNFLARMSHELRTPLNAILGCTQLMHHDNSLTQALREYVSIISHSSEHLLNLIDDVLEMSKIEAGKIVLEETKFDFYVFLNNLQEMLQIKAKDKNLQLIFAIHPNCPQYVKADERKIRQILLNLLGNAIKFTSKGYVLLRVSQTNMEEVSSKVVIHFEVEDSGLGIAPEEIDKLFEAFVQTASGRATQTGTGLGLVISQQFAHFMGSHIHVSSTLNKGSVFQFDIAVEQLPCEEVETQQQIDSEKPNVVITEEEFTQAVPSSLRILLVEDNTFNQMIALRLLAKLGYQADCAINGLEVLKALESKSYDLILWICRCQRWMVWKQLAKYVSLRKIYRHLKR